MQARHQNRLQYFNEQAQTTQEHVIPFLEDVMNIDKSISVLEIGCGEGGNLVPFLDMNCSRVVGLDIGETQINNAKAYFKDHDNRDKLELITADIYEIESLGKFDLIFTRDVIEHIHNQERFVEFIKKFFKPNTIFYMGFPPWYMPFGGHQQLCKNKLLSSLPYYHILPRPIYKFILKAFGETEHKVESLLEIKDTGISIERLERMLKKSGYKIDKKDFYFINPNYQTKFGLKPRKQWKLFSMIPFIRNFTMTAAYYAVSVKQ